MALYSIAGFIIDIENKYDYTTDLCRKYACDAGEPIMRFEASEEEIELEVKRTNGEFSRGYCESICIYRKFGMELTSHNAFVMHASTFSIDGKGYAITAPSGTGKSTHTRMLHRYLGKRMDIINGDKPIIRLKDGVPYACGSPWCGKENWSKNRCAPLEGIVFIERSKENFIEKLDKKTAARQIMHQIFRPSDMERLSKTLSLVNEMIEYTSTWRLGCDISEEAARLSYKTITGAKDED